MNGARLVARLKQVCGGVTFTFLYGVEEKSKNETALYPIRAWGRLGVVSTGRVCAGRRRGRRWWAAAVVWQRAAWNLARTNVVAIWGEWHWGRRNGKVER